MFILFFIVKDGPDGASNAGPVASHHVAAVSLRGQPAIRDSCTHCWEELSLGLGTVIHTVRSVVHTVGTV